MQKECCYCKRWYVPGANNWYSPTPQEKEQYPGRVTHGVCRDCLPILEKEFDVDLSDLEKKVD